MIYLKYIEVDVSPENLHEINMHLFIKAHILSSITMLNHDKCVDEK